MSGLFKKLGGGMRLERFKLAVYIIGPIFAVVIYSQPSVHETALKQSRYIVYTNPKVPVFTRKPAARKDGTSGEGTAAEEVVGVEGAAQMKEEEEEERGIAHEGAVSATKFGGSTTSTGLVARIAR